VANEHDRACDGREEVLDLLGIAGQATQGAVDGLHDVPVALQALNVPIPAGGIGPGTVYQHDGRLGGAVGACGVGGRCGIGLVRRHRASQAERENGQEPADQERQ
jgi:hypothetical protein